MSMYSFPVVAIGCASMYMKYLLRTIGENVFGDATRLGYEFV